MSLKKVASTAILAVATTVVVAGTASAAPVAGPSPSPSATASHVVNWAVSREGSHVLVKTAGGSLSTESGRLVVRDSQGTVADSIPLSLVAQGVAYPVSARVSGNSATLVTETDRGVKFTDKYPGVKPVDLPAAISAVQSPISLTASVGGYLGAATGLVSGCLLGAAVGGAVSAPAALLFGAGPLAGCVGGALLLGSGASLAGTVIGGLGAVAANTPRFIELVNQPPAPKK